MTEEKKTDAVEAPPNSFGERNHDADAPQSSPIVYMYAGLRCLPPGFTPDLPGCRINETKHSGPVGSLAAALSHQAGSSALTHSTDRRATHDYFRAARLYRWARFDLVRFASHLPCQSMVVSLVYTQAPSLSVSRSIACVGLAADAATGDRKAKGGNGQTHEGWVGWQAV